MKRLAKVKRVFLSGKAFVELEPVERLVIDLEWEINRLRRKEKDE